MCLLDAVAEWTAQRIICTASSHRTADHPLRAYGRLGAACGIEYAAQAMAVHGALCAPLDHCGKPPPGFLFSVRDVTLHVSRLDDIAADLSIEAERISGDANVILYRFSLAAPCRRLLDGRAAVILAAEETGGAP